MGRSETSNFRLLFVMSGTSAFSLLKLTIISFMVEGWGCLLLFFNSREGVSKSTRKPLTAP